MCGICGFVSNNELSIANLIEMNKTLKHRGPDDNGEEIYQLKSNRYVGFAQRRLSILDLSSKGHQPMHSYDRRVSVVFNGEIYNFKELREELTNYPFTSNCDTEVIIAAYLKWGISFLEKLNGMFAIALLDRDIDTIYLIRDRMGKKPLYYYVGNNKEIVFASELKAIMVCPIFNVEIDKSVVGRFLYKTYIASPNTIFKNTYKLEPGSVLTISNNEIKSHKYWDVATKYKELRSNQITDYEEAKQEFRDLLRASVKRRMVSDVPVGAFLSGGYDSSLVCAVAQEILEKPLKTFSIGFYEDGFNEAPYAKEIANALGTEHMELYISENDMLQMIDDIPDYYDEPFADASEIPTMIISGLAKEKVSVVLTGDGGDELFGGYGIYGILQKVQKLKETNSWEVDNKSITYRILKDCNNPEIFTQGGVQGYFDVINSILVSPMDSFYYEFESKYQEPRYDIRRMLLDIETSLPDQMLTKVDRASMKYALEARCPFMDKDVVEFSFRCHPNFKAFQGISKRIVKDVNHEYLPAGIMDRPKMGFGIPQDKWLRGCLKDRVMDLSNEEFLARQGIFEPKKTMNFIESYMKEGDQGKWSGHNYSRIVWSYFMFQQWYEKYGLVR
jgi:asparagine synthase (glutamine-hydrolysing)